ncbi:MAG: DUF115 domain-containing protein [Phycisphaerales bacterium]|nr:DUF115 domain-containing protein [Phycisphaerales bacterium]
MSNTASTIACVYVRNVGALWHYDPRLAMALEAVHPEDLPGVETARDGNFTVRMKGVYLHSRYRPVHEAQSWAAGVKCDEKYAVVLSGFGLGYHVRALFERLSAEALLVVAEPSLTLLKVAMEQVDLSDVIASGRLMIFTSLDRGVLVERLEPRSVMLTAGTGMLFASLPTSQQTAAEFHAAFCKQMTEFVAFTRTSFVTLMLNNVTTCRNIANNLGRYATTPPVDLLEGAYAGLPAVLVAAGPSLQKNMHLLHELKGDGTSLACEPPAEPGADGRAARKPRRAVIIAVQTMLKPLLAAGIEPDFVTSLDYNTVSTRFFENLEESGSTGRVHLVAEAKANWNVLDVFTGSMSLIHNEFASQLLQGALPRRAALKAGATVAHLSFYLAEFLGCNPIILVGQDLGFVDGLYYKPGTAIHETWGPELGRFNTLETKEWERIARSRTVLRKIPDIQGHPMYTEEQFFVYLQQFERDFAAARAAGRNIIDATEGGACKEHVTVMPLREAIDRYCKHSSSSNCVDFYLQDRAFAPTGATAVGGMESHSGAAVAACRGLKAAVPTGANPCISSPRNWEMNRWKTWRCDAVANLEKVIGALRQRCRCATEMKEICGQTVPLLREMIASQGDEAAMSRLFVDVDRLRSRVGADPATFEMVCFLNTIGELRKFQADLGVKSAKDPLDRQKRQLLRDIDYVQNLEIGAQRLLEIVDEALARLDKQLLAVRENRPWPREVAGSAT